MGKQLLLMFAVLAFSLMSHAAIAQDSDKPRLASELKELAWLIGQYGEVRTEDNVLIAHLTIAIRDNGESLQAFYELGMVEGLPARVAVVENIRWNRNQESITCDFTIEEVEGTFWGLDETVSYHNTGKGSYVLQKGDDEANRWNGKGQFTSATRERRKFKFNLVRTETGFNYSANGESYTFKRKE